MKYKIKEIYTSEKGRITAETIFDSYDDAIEELTEHFNSRGKTGTTELMLIGIDDGITVFAKTVYKGGM